MARECGMEQPPNLCYVVVSKRINTRFFTKGQRQGEYGNPFSGTTVDDVVTLPERYDFFLISQSVRQGTVNPTSYNVIYNTNKWSPGNFQVRTTFLHHDILKMRVRVRLHYVTKPC